MLLEKLNKKRDRLERLPIYGFQSVSLIDFPKVISSVVFTGFCNLRCPYCHNSSLVFPEKLPQIPIDDLILKLDKRRKLIKGVAITGGEPLLFEEIIDFLIFLKENLPYKIKIDTNGTNYNILETIIKESLVDYVAMDVKTLIPKYKERLGLTDLEKEENILKSIELLKKATSIGREFRITLEPSILPLEEVEEYGELIKGDVPLYIQKFNNVNVLDPSWKNKPNVTDDIVKTYSQILQKYTSVYTR